MISAGIMTEVVTLQKNAYARNEAGEQVQGFAEIRKVRANVKFNKGNRALSQGDVWNPTTIVVTTRYADAFMQTNRVVWLDRQYMIDSINPDRINGTLTITATLVDE